MVMPGGRRGAGSMGCITSLLLLALMVYLANQFGRPWFRYQQFRDEMRTNARFAVTLPDSVILTRLRARADSLRLPEAAQRISIVRTGRPGSITISTTYVEVIKLILVGEKRITFTPKAEEPL